MLPLLFLLRLCLLLVPNASTITTATTTTTPTIHYRYLILYCYSDSNCCYVLISRKLENSTCSQCCKAEIFILRSLYPENIIFLPSSEAKRLRNFLCGVSGARSQSRVSAGSTGALNTNSRPLNFDFKSAGSGALDWWPWCPLPCACNRGACINCTSRIAVPVRLLLLDNDVDDVTGHAE